MKETVLLRSSTSFNAIDKKDKRGEEIEKMWNKYSVNDKNHKKEEKRKTIVMINTGRRTEWSPIRSVIIRVSPLTN